MAEKEIEKKMYLNNFPEPTNPDMFRNERHIKVSGQKVIEILKKEGLTYEDAYASLQYAYDKIKYESNFLKLN